MTTGLRFVLALARVVVPVAALLVLLSTAVFIAMRGATLDLGWLTIGSSFGPGPLPWPAIILGAVPSLLLAYGLLRLWRLAGALRAGRYFAVATIGHLRAFAGALFLSGLADLIAQAVVPNLLPGAPAGITLSLETDGLLDLGLAGVFFVVAHVLNVARANAETLEDFV